MLSQDRDLLTTMVEQTVRQVREVAIGEALQVSKNERSEYRVGQRSGYHCRTFITRAGGQDGVARAAGSTQAVPLGVFERYQPGERAAMLEMYVRAFPHAR